MKWFRLLFLTTFCSIICSTAFGHLESDYRQTSNDTISYVPFIAVRNIGAEGKCVPAAGTDDYHPIDQVKSYNRRSVDQRKAMVSTEHLPTSTSFRLAQSKAIVEVKDDSAQDWTIVMGVASEPMDSLAARDLQRYVTKMTGDSVPIITDAQIPTTFNVFLVGKRGTNTKIEELASGGLIHIDDSFPGSQGFINKTVDYSGRHYCVLAGCDELGVQYAVYDFLERYCKVGFLLDGDNIPWLDSLLVTNLDVARKPYCQYRQQSVYGAGKLWYGAGTWPTLDTVALDGYQSGWKNFIDWMAKKKQNVLYMKRGFFNIGYITGFPELNNPSDIENINRDAWWFNTDFTARLARQLIVYARYRGMKICFTATICRIPDCFIDNINDPTHPCYGLRYEDMGSWIRLDPLDPRSYSYCLRKHVEGIVAEFGMPDFWYGYYAWSEQDTTMGLPFRSYCHHMAHDLVFDSVGGPLIVYTWDWGTRVSFDAEWAGYKSVMPHDSSVILAVNNSIIPSQFLDDPAGPFALYPWWCYLTPTTNDQYLPEQFRNVSISYSKWRTILQRCSSNPPAGFGLDNMIHHVDQRLTDFECTQADLPDVLGHTLDDYLTDYVKRAYEPDSASANLFELHRLWVSQHSVTTGQVEQYMIPEWFRLKDRLVYRTDLTEAIYYEATDYDQCALLYDKPIYSNEFTSDWADVNIPPDAWVEANRSLWQFVLTWPPGMTWENRSSYLPGILPGELTIQLRDTLGNPVPDQQIVVKRGHLTKIIFQDSFSLVTNGQGEAMVSLNPDVWEVTVPNTERQIAVLMLHDRDKTITITLGPGTAREETSELRELKFAIEPNPAVNGVTVQYSLPVQCPIQCEFFDISGALVQDYIVSKPSPEGVLRINVHALPAGIYFLRFNTGKATVTRKIVLGR